LPKPARSQIKIDCPASAVTSARPSSDLIQQALDWLFEQPEALAYDQAEAAQRQAAPGRHEE
jgi:hypothetical protein